MVEQQARIAIPKKNVVELAWSPDGKMLAASYKDRVVRVWNTRDLETWTLHRELKGHSSWVHGVSWSYDGRYLASAGEDETVRVWDVAERRQIQELDHDGRVSVVAWSPANYTLATGSDDRLARIWDGTTANLQYQRPLSGYVRALAWTPDGGRLIAADLSGQVIWVEEAQSTGFFRVASPALSIAWMPKQEGWAEGRSDGSIWVTSARHQLERHQQGVSNLAFSPGGEVLVSGAPGEKLCLWRCDTWEFVGHLPGRPPRYFPYGLAFHPDLPLLAMVAEDGAAIHLLRLDVKRILEQTPAEETVHYSNAKVVLVGDTGVGKTGLGLVLSGKSFEPTESTHGRNVWPFGQTVVTSEDGVGVRRETLLWDLAGQPSYRLIHQLSLNEAAVAIVVFDSRNETDPFAGVQHWARALRQAERASGERRIHKILVASRLDRGGVAVSKKRIHDVVAQLGFDGYFETSAKEGWGIQELKEAVTQAIGWDQLPHVSSSTLFDRIRTFLVEEKEGGSLLATEDELYRAFLRSYDDTPPPDLEQQFQTCVGLAESRGLLRRLSFGGFILLQAELLEAYASAIINAARAEPDGLGSISEENIRQRKFFVPRECRIEDRAREELLLIATIEELIRHEIALKENTDPGPILVFPSQYTREWPEAPDPPGRAVVFHFEGPVASIYSTLVVRLSRSGLFTLHKLWRNAVQFTAGVGGCCGLFLQEEEEGKGGLTLFYEGASEETRYHFEGYVYTHLSRRAHPETIHRERVFVCAECGTPVTALQATRRRGRGLDWIACSVCDAKVSLSDGVERLAAASPQMVHRMDESAQRELRREQIAASLQGKIKAGDFDLFVCYNSRDLAEVQEITEELKREHGILPWVDIDELPPGKSWIEGIQKQIETMKAAAVFFGSAGPGPWQRREVNAMLSHIVNNGRPVIPVLLRTAGSEPALPLFLQDVHWVDFRRKSPPPMQRLVWGITGRKDEWTEA